MIYTHTQHGPLKWILGAVALTIAVVARQASHAAPAAAVGLAILAGTVFVLALCFGSLTVSAGADRLKLRYGPLPLFGTSIPYASIESAEATHSAFIDGWGIHWVPGGQIGDSHEWHEANGIRGLRGGGSAPWAW